MFCHIVLMRISGADAAFHDRMSAYVSRVRTELPYVRSYAFVPNLADRAVGYDWAVVSSFDTAEDHHRYQVSDVHQEMKDYVTTFIDSLVVCDAKTD